MAHVRWSIPIGVREHTIELDHGFWSGKRVIRVDGQVVAEGKRFLDFGSTQTFLIDGHPCAVHIVTASWPNRYLLSVDGKIVAGSPNARLQPKTQALVLFVFALGFAVGAGALMVLAPSRIPDSTALRQIDGTIEARKISSDQYSRTLYLTLLGTTQRLKHDSSDAHYRRVEAAIRTGDSISAWVDGRLVVTSDPLEIWQLSRGREIIVPYQDQVAARSISNTFSRILGVIALIGALFTLAASVRRWQESDRATTVGHDRGGEAPRMPTTSTSLLPIRIPPIRLVALTLGLGLVAWSSWATYQALSVEADGLVRLVGIYEGIVIGIPTVIIAFDQLKLTDRWTGRLLRLSLLVAVGLPVLLPWYFLPQSLLARIFGLDLAPVAAVLLLATAAPVGSLLMPAAAVLLPLAPQVKRIAALAIWALGILDTLFVMSATPASAYREVWLVASVALATVYLAVAFRVARLIPKR